MKKFSAILILFVIACEPKEKSSGYEINSDYMVAQYNSPWALPPFRRNEIIIMIK